MKEAVTGEALLESLLFPFVGPHSKCSKCGKAFRSGDLVHVIGAKIRVGKSPTLAGHAVVKHTACLASMEALLEVILEDERLRNLIKPVLGEALRFPLGEFSS